MRLLFPPLSVELRRDLQVLLRALDAVMPLNTAHRRDLPLAIEELSTRLTCDRSALHKPYWSAPRLTSAYLRYFLPWNLLRLLRLFGGLTLPAPAPCSPRQNEAPLPRVLVDIGSGPLTVPLALWLARPQWRTTPLTVLCLDSAPRPLELGRQLFLAVAGQNTPWRIITRRCAADAFFREAREVPGVPWLLTAANMLNELKLRPGQQENDRLAGIVEQSAHLLTAPDAAALFVEPGTRLGGKTLVSLREIAIEEGLFPVQPCPHGNNCPLQGCRTWCHFTFDAAGAPDWLETLSRAARLSKDALSLAFALFRPAGTISAAASPAAGARVISAPFAVPGLPGMARYACTDRGLALLAAGAACPSGTLVEVHWPRTPAKDRKSGALILMPEEYTAPQVSTSGGMASSPVRTEIRPQRLPASRPAEKRFPSSGKSRSDEKNKARRNYAGPGKPRRSR